MSNCVTIPDPQAISYTPRKGDRVTVARLCNYSRPSAPPPPPPKKKKKYLRVVVPRTKEEDDAKVRVEKTDLADLISSGWSVLNYYCKHTNIAALAMCKLQKAFYEADKLKNSILYPAQKYLALCARKIASKSVAPSF
jgi:hypothetical protein